MTLNEEMENHLDTCQVEAILNDYDIILPRPYAFSKDSIKSQFIFYHDQENYDFMINAIERLFPKYMESANEVLNRRFEYLANLLIAKKAVFDAYSEWLFAILQDIENHIDLDDEKNRRMLGYMGERLLNVYVAHNNLKIKEVPQIFITGANNGREKDEYIDFRYIKRRYFAGILSVEQSILGKFKSK